MSASLDGKNIPVSVIWTLTIPYLEPNMDVMRSSTTVIHADRVARAPGEISPAIHQGVNFGAASADDFREAAGTPFHPEFYTRHGNANHSQVAAIIAELEGADKALVAASGMGAFTTAVLTFLGAGDHVVAQASHYTGVGNQVNLLWPQLGIECTKVDQTDLAAVSAALRPNTRLILLETPANPRLEITDLKGVAELARAKGALTLVDNTLATPINQRPLDFGIDLSWHSATKYLGGHADLLAGVIAGPRSLIDQMWATALMCGAILAPFSAWLLLRGLRTLPLRVDRHNRNAMAIAEVLQGHRAISRVHYPGLPSDPGHLVAEAQMSGFGGLLSFEFADGPEAANAFLEGMRLAKRAPSLGTVSSLAVQPEAYWNRIQEGSTFKGDQRVSPALVRFAAGIEDTEDLVEDVLRAVNAGAV